ncbi:D-isomer specific 2-hydroxyacid dehydrogenase NAD-binding [Geobacter metallireducens RCH3]|uniref:Hydroxypyruvate reductase, putative n=1 Tax=Geobacter metallireducens (strain ATCC 53774 / DSM 7210 / GS-15) TaxID=269799 RepID=Q39S61_GEOMG|nr:D-2-hydroxyacid dehydrogenase [Geobacter metallireducens]ABB32913.1 hydroxypyruvate reductase, putative [Geobacter metallireducens GS-15]EHP88953.1 D-isomer specific 2-hydroxyacid dehydrogenase NAD-binding [Geobacter metallireducens RCH3]
MGERTRIVILDGYTINPGDNPWTPVEEYGDCTIHDRTPPELKLERARDAEIILTSKVKLDEATIAALPRLRYISLLATGYNNVDVAAAGRRGIPVSNVPAYSTESVAQTAFALLLELTTRVGLHDAAVRGGEWSHCPDHSFWKTSIVELDGLTLGIVGYGAIGRAVARIAQAFGMRTIAHAPRIPADPGPVPVRFVSLEELFATADVVTLNCPQTPENTEFVNEGLLSLMKRSAYLINVARGGLVNEADLARALRDGTLAGAGLDVVAHEPMLPDNPLLAAPNCIFTPHLAWASLAARRRLTGVVAANVAAFLAGSPINVVNGPWLAGGR